MSVHYSFSQRIYHSYIFLLITWILIGFAIGTIMLLFPIRLWVDYVRDHHFSGAAETTGVVVMILALIIISFIISKQIFQWQKRKQKVLITAFAMLVPLLCAGAAMRLFMNPELINKDAVATQVSSQFMIGPYPTKDKIKSLKKQGFTGIISLLHPAVVPFEPALLAEEEMSAKEYGITLIKAPMLPWVGDNSASLQRIEEIARTNKGKFYIHCYLGKDRVNLVKNMITKIKGNATSIAVNQNTYRTFEEQKLFERGTLYKLDEQVYLTPFPTNEEVLAFLQTGYIKTVVNIMSAVDAEAKMRIDDEEKVLKLSGTTFKNIAITERSTVEEISAIIDSISQYQKPIAVHHWNTVCPESILFKKTFANKSGKAAINLTTNVAEFN